MPVAAGEQGGIAGQQGISQQNSDSRTSEFLLATCAAHLCKSLPSESLSVGRLWLHQRSLDRVVKQNVYLSDPFCRTRKKLNYDAWMKRWAFNMHVKTIYIQCLVCDCPRYATNTAMEFLLCLHVCACIHVLGSCIFYCDIVLW